MSQMLKASGAVAAATLISRLLGLVREMIYARFMGNGWVASAFMLAFQVPNLFRRLLGEGALTAAFIPQFKAQEKTEGEAAMWHSANAVISALLTASALIVGVAMFAISALLAAGDFDERTRLMLRLLRTMFPYMIFICLAAVCMGMLNARGRFFVPALGAALLNLVMIASVLFLAPQMGGTLPDQIHALAIGVLLAGFAQAVFQLPTLFRDGWRYRWVTPWRNPTVRETIRRMIPTTIGVAAFQLNVVITQGFAFAFGESIVASFQYAVRLMELPQALFGVSLATYLLPSLSGLAAEKKYEEFRGTLLQGLSHLLFVNVLAATLLVTLARPIVRLLFEGGLFHPSATLSVAGALSFLAPALIGYSGTAVLARAFYAVGDTKVPMQIGVFCLAVNAVLSILFALPGGEAGLALANTLTACMNVALLGHGLKRKFPQLRFATLLGEARMVGVAACVAAVLALLLGAGWEARVGSQGVWARLGSVFVPATLAAGAYFGLLWRWNLPACRMIAGMVPARFRRSGNRRTGA